MRILKIGHPLQTIAVKQFEMKILFTSQYLQIWIDNTLSCIFFNWQVLIAGIIPIANAIYNN